MRDTGRYCQKQLLLSEHNTFWIRIETYNVKLQAHFAQNDDEEVEL